MQQVQVEGAVKPWKRSAKFAVHVGTGVFGAVVGVVLSTGWAMLYGVDQVANAALGGDPRMTYSARCGFETRAGDPSWHCKFNCEWLQKLDPPDHCEEAAKYFQRTMPGVLNESN